MKAEEMKPCDGCGGELMYRGSPLFYRVTIEPFVVDLAAAKRRYGGELMMGPLASVLGAQEDVANTIPGAEFRKLLCLNCATDGTTVAALMTGGEE